MILERYPMAARARDNQGLLPVQVALLHSAPFPIIDALLDEYPEAASVPDHEGAMLLHYAALQGAPAGTLRSILQLYPLAAQMIDKVPRGVGRLHIVTDTHTHTHTGDGVTGWQLAPA